MSTLVTPHVPRPWWRRKTPWIFIAVAALLAGGGVAVPMVLNAARTCADGVVHRDHECVGVTDGSYEFDPALADVQRRIRAENEDVLGSGKPYVTIGFFAQMTVTEKDSVSMGWVKHQLQGAYLAQYRANHDRVAGDLPLVRLLIANAGSQIAAWEPVVNELLTRTAAPDHLVAVAGMGTSTENARKAMNRLSEQGILMLGSTVTSDDLRKIPNLLRMAPTNSGQAKAVASYIKPKVRKALLVQDDSRSDLYPATLATSFTDNFPDQDHKLVGQTEFYDSSLPSVDNTFLQMMPNICNSKPEVVFFAGRGKHLASFVTQLTGRRCQEHRITVLSGDDVSTAVFGEGVVRRALDSGVEVVFTTLAHPEAWNREPKAFEKDATFIFAERICSYCFPTAFPDDSLEDAAAIMAYDSVLTAVFAIRRSSGKTAGVVSAKEVLQTRNRLHDTMSVPGASGWLSFDKDGTAVGKAVPIVKLRADGTAEFLSLSSS
ncbi:ABC transporter substrate-binding protein [Lentzea sp. NBC_00516]|uniref:ABC transporter substrate-binding protein n=1 Tax=Lentzea sp. NBC_00516 TaxID=2903582 RepID=UPI002E818E77|nr:ABC transporter substrate-binding protein [Lentzea sp. NBC_00516]WUD29276.1 ABC transporter substrate-binding protein [Lentzea sp. NBC_00516]